ncbi:MAG: PDZ domain-containing protein [Candidatus Niyogibacteria bacterium]|nr:PDZ domain-containing protein [Candidatus Niyogibacteria bacterium]
MKNFVTVAFFAFLLMVPFGAFAEQETPANSGPSPDEMYQMVAMHYTKHVAPMVGEAGVEKLRTEVARYPFHGVGISIMPPDDLARVKIAGLWKGSPAMVAGLHTGDWIVAVNGQACSDSGDKCIRSVVDSIREAPETFVLEVLRSLEKLSFTLTKAMIGEEIPKLAAPRMAEWNASIRAQENAAREFVTRMVASAGNPDELRARSAELGALTQEVNKPFTEFQKIVDSYLIRE